jgi:hypothetical protein
MYLSPEARRLLDDVRGAHERLIAHFNATDDERQGFRAVYDELESALADLDETRLREPIEDGRSGAEILVHIAEHDHKVEEAQRRGLAHMVEHGMRHARALHVAHDARPVPVARRAPQH